MTHTVNRRSGGISRSDQWIALVLTSTLAIYFPVAYWSARSHVPLPEPKGAVIHLQGFHMLGPPGTFSYYSVAQLVQKNADTTEAPQRSPYIVYEDDKPLGPAHSTKEEIELIGRGRFLHQGDIFVFSASDNSDPRTNGRSYWVVLPAS
jgi:hypothetical protein